jgi:hypothetical protein
MLRRRWCCNLGIGCQSPVLEGAARGLCLNSTALAIFSSEVGYFRLAQPDQPVDATPSKQSNLRDAFPIGMGDQTARAARRGLRGPAALLHEAPASARQLQRLVRPQREH